MYRLFPDTHPKIEELQIELLRSVEPWRKLEMVWQMNETVRTMLLSGLRSRHPDDRPAVIDRRLAGLLLGEELAQRVYGPLEMEMLAEPLAATLQANDALEGLGVPYWMGGSLASALHGVARATIATDLVAGLKMAHVEGLASALEEAFYVDDEMIRDAIHHQSSFNLIHRKSMFKISIFILSGRPFDRMQLERRVEQIVTTDPERTAYVCTAEDIILAKLEWYKVGGEVSERQWRDVMGVMRVQSETLDRDYLRKWAAELEVLDLLERALSESF